MNIKHITIRISAIILLVALGLFSCNDEPTPAEKTEALLISGIWSNPVVTVDGIDQSDLYQIFTITFTKTNYTTAGGSPLWLSSGTWAFKDENAKVLILDGSHEVPINEITETNLELVVQNDNTTFKSGRVNSVKGANKFRLTKK